ncbi:MAG: carbamoyltransferase HypF [Acidobacteria bacterium]|nr:carbamoyltransferase HypF [Acidobacteriota bacterium]MCB9397627.1 carbamoyltransferase HypF [Acidobacteriota bacterium]
MNARYHININGIVQGVGFRPFVYRLAQEEGVSGWVNNGAQGVQIEVEGPQTNLNRFLARIAQEKPTLAQIDTVQHEVIPCVDSSGFRIQASSAGEKAQTLISPDMAVCTDCLKDMRDPQNRRFQYPFTNCTNCGPRFTIIQGLPYDRPSTTMGQFEMCAACRREYEDPNDRRFHAQPIACPACGPHIWLEIKGQRIGERQAALFEAAQLIRNGNILALRGLGGFHLAVDPFNEKAIACLRRRKHRLEKPFALMIKDLQAAEAFVDLDAHSKTLLCDSRRPIVLMPRRAESKLAQGLAPGQSRLGLMLPYTPLHYLLMDQGFDALVMTSGNLSDEPIAASNEEARERLAALADGLLLHNRDIHMRCDDSVFLSTERGPLPIRRARGYVPQPICLSEPVPLPLFACGGQYKAAHALARGNQVFLSQHLGDLEHLETLDFFQESKKHLQQTLEIEPEVLICDMHPDYLSSKWARSQPMPRIEVQHHHAHLAALHAEHQLKDPILCLTLDGSGYGPDRTIWGGELLYGNPLEYKRLAWLEPVPMPGAAQAIYHPARMACAYLRALLGPDWLTAVRFTSMNEMQLQTLDQMMQSGLNSPLTSSCGRLFDAVAALIGLHESVTFEGQAAMALEALASGMENQGRYPEQEGLGPLRWHPLIEAVLEKRANGVSGRKISADFHADLAQLWCSACIQVRQQTQCNQVGLSGGVFQNSLFSRLLIRELLQNHFEIYWHQKVPPNDGGLALGQIAVASSLLRNGRVPCVSQYPVA